MVKFAIPDIRYFWTQDPRFMKQFKAGNLSAKFKPYSKFPPCLKVSHQSFPTHNERFLEHLNFQSEYIWSLLS